MKIAAAIFYSCYCVFFSVMAKWYVMGWKGTPPLINWMYAAVLQDPELGQPVVDTISISQKGKNELVLSGTVDNQAIKSKVMLRANDVKNFYATKSYYQQKEMIITDNIIVVEKTQKKLMCEVTRFFPALPGLLFIGAGAVLPNLKYFTYTRDEEFALLWAGVLVLVMTVGIHFGLQYMLVF